MVVWPGHSLSASRTAWEWTLWALWEDGDQAPWVLLTDLPLEISDAAWYRPRLDGTGL
jgi:hypothetical protein